MPRITAQIDTRQLRILARSEPIAHLPWAVSPYLEPEKINALQQAMLSMNDSNEGRRLLKSAGMSGIRPASDSEYDTTRIIIKRATGENYGSPASNHTGMSEDG
jgi:phosphonate transport system substrate-binding protein